MIQSQKLLHAQHRRNQSDITPASTVTQTKYRSIEEQESFRVLLKQPFTTKNSKVIPQIGMGVLKDTFYRRMDEAEEAKIRKLHPLGDRRSGKKSKKRKEDYGDMFARILYDYCLGDPTREKKLSPREEGDDCEEEEEPRDQTFVGGVQMIEGPHVRKPKKCFQGGSQRNYGDKLLRMCKVIPTFEAKMKESLEPEF